MFVRLALVFALLALAVAADDLTPPPLATPPLVCNATAPADIKYSDCNMALKLFTATDAGIKIDGVSQSQTVSSCTVNLLDPLSKTAGLVISLADATKALSDAEQQCVGKPGNVTVASTGGDVIVRTLSAAGPKTD